MITFRCPLCDRHLQAPDEKAGAEVSCPNCQCPVVIGFVSQAATDKSEPASKHFLPVWASIAFGALGLLILLCFLLIGILAGSRNQATQAMPQELAAGAIVPELPGAQAQLELIKSQQAELELLLRRQQAAALAAEAERVESERVIQGWAAELEKKMEMEFWDDAHAILTKPLYPRSMTCSTFIDAFRRNASQAQDAFAPYRLTITHALIAEIIAVGGRRCVVLGDPSGERQDLFVAVWTKDELGVLGLEKGQTVTAIGVLPPRFANMGRPIMVGAVRR